MSDEGRRVIEQAVADKRIPVTYDGSTAMVRLADVYAALAARSEPPLGPMLGAAYLEGVADTRAATPPAEGPSIRAGKVERRPGLDLTGYGSEPLDKFDIGNMTRAEQEGRSEPRDVDVGDGRPPLDPATKAHDDAYMAGLIRGRELEREALATVHYHRDTGDLPWPGPVDADCHTGIASEQPE